MPSWSVVPLPAQSTAKPLDSPAHDRALGEILFTFPCCLGSTEPCCRRCAALPVAITAPGTHKSILHLRSSKPSACIHERRATTPRAGPRSCSQELKAEKPPKQLAAQQLYSPLRVICALQEPNCQNHDRCKAMQIHQELMWLFITAAVAA